jgi:Protein of unknown function (DUF3558)
MPRATWSLFALTAIALLAACGTTSTSTATPTPTTPPATATPAPTPTPTVVPTTTDPCQLVTSQEASSLAGASYGAGRPDTTSGGAKICIYGYQTLNVFLVLVAVATDAATAQADWAQEEAKAQAALNQGAGQGANITFNLNDVANLPGADRAAVGTASGTVSGQTISGSAIYLLKGPIFFTFSDVGLGITPPSISAMEAQAQTSLARLP